MAISSYVANYLLSKWRIFVSYHHANDQQYYNQFSQLFSQQFEVIQDNSLDRRIESDDVEYVMRQIREKYIIGSSCTIVLCGEETYKRKYVDWEIKATLDKEHGLIAVILPTVQITNDGYWIAPDRLYDNLISGYAIQTTWQELIWNFNLLLSLIPDTKSLLKNLKPKNEGLNFPLLSDLIEQANARPKNLINNFRPLKRKNDS